MSADGTEVFGDRKKKKKKVRVEDVVRTGPWCRLLAAARDPARVVLSSGAHWRDCLVDAQARCCKDAAVCLVFCLA